MANNFFSRFPKIPYTISDGQQISLTDISKNVDADDFFATTSAYYTFYEIQDGERPDTVSYKLYENPDYHWTFFVLNNVLRAGMNSAWPLSLNQLERMLTREYDKYSVVSFMPYNDSNPGLNISGLMHLTNFHATYLPYLRIVNSQRTQKATVLKYDNSLLQLFIYDIENNDGTPVSSIKSFIESDFFQLSWYNPYVENTEEYITCNNLKNAFVRDVFDAYSEFDSGTAIDTSIYEGLLSQSDIDQAIANRQEQYVFNKRYKPVAQRSLKWISARDAASEYYEEINDTRRSKSAYDVLSNENLIVPKYISYYERETIINERKEKIRVVRKERINDFVSSYFNTLNG